MFRSFVFIGVLFGLGACASGQSGGDGSLLRRAQTDVQFRKDVRNYSQFAIARYASLTDDPKVAAENYSRIILESPTNSTIAERAVFSALLVGDVETAISLSTHIPGDTLQSTELARLSLALKAVQAGAYADALSHLESPWDSAFHAAIARSVAAWIALEDYPDQAIQLQELAGDRDPVLTGVSHNLAALMRLNIGRMNEASEAFEYLWHHDAKLAIGVEAHARLMALAGQPDAAMARIRDFREIVGRNPSLSHLARNIDAGTVSPAPVLTTQQGIALSIYAVTAALANQSENDLPSVYFAMALYLDPELDAAKTLWADTLDRTHRREEAIELLMSVPETSIYHTNAQGQLAWVYRRQGRNDEALTLALQTLEATDDRNIRVQLADLLQSLGRDGEAEETFTQIIDADKLDGIYDWRVYFARGAARERLGEWPPAEGDLTTAMGLKPNNPTIMNYLGYGWIDRGMKLEQGLELIEGALRLSPRSGSITDSLGWAHYKTGNYDRAVFYLERATELSPQNPEILDHLGDTYWQVGRYTEAGYQWQRALQYSADEAFRTQVEKKLLSGLALLNVTPSSGSDGP